ncbi:universal stress protein [Nocardia bovistercoris]|uniref:Universal stress protein n=1 Tax=Nocardia bovistercoris TaxID=2785916 RepID=A0A931IHX3_9NOCA|nr:universal stress protein [Nocardia bovistercoris]MBH0781736.1 universal stress protein [Nocardia bovistercoris]
MNTRNDSHVPKLAAPVVVGVNSSAGSRQALRWAAEAAATSHRPLRIVFGLDLFRLSATVESREAITPAIIDSMRGNAHTVLVDAAELARQIAPTIDIDVEICDESPAKALIERSESAHMVVLGATGDVGTFGHLGSTLLNVTSHGHGSIVVVRGGERPPEGPVVVGIDGSPVSESAIAAGFAEASARGARLVAVHSWSDWGTGDFAGKHPVVIDANQLETAEQAILAERLAGWQEKYPDVEVIRKVYLAGPTQTLMQWSARARLLVVGSRGRGGFTGLLLGSTSNYLVQHADCPVLVAHSA